MPPRGCSSRHGTERVFDLVVVGGGMGGLATAALAAAARAAHGPAGGTHQARRLCRLFPARAVHLRRRGHGPDGPGAGRADRRPARRLGLDFQAVRTPATGSTCPTGRRHRPRRRRASRPRPPAALSRSGDRGPRQRRFWRLQAAVGDTLFRPRPGPEAAGPEPGATWSTTSASWASGGPCSRPPRSLTVQDVLRLLGLDATCRSGRWSPCSCRTPPRPGPRPSRSPTPRPASRPTAWG